jgi:hypothetical protein
MDRPLTSWRENPSVYGHEGVGIVRQDDGTGSLTFYG